MGDPAKCVLKETKRPVQKGEQSPQGKGPELRLGQMVTQLSGVGTAPPLSSATSFIR